MKTLIFNVVGEALKNVVQECNMDTLLVRNINQLTEAKRFMDTQIERKGVNRALLGQQMHFRDVLSRKSQMNPYSIIRGHLELLGMAQQPPPKPPNAEYLVVNPLLNTCATFLEPLHKQVCKKGI